MPNRILKDSICTSENIESLGSWEVEVFWYRLLVQCDDYGRMDARPAILRARCYPLAMNRVSEANIAKWLLILQDAGLIEMYTIDSKPYLHIATWEKHQQVRAKHSKYPSPPERASNGNHMISDASYSLRESRIENRESESTTADQMTKQYEAVLGMVPTASYPEMTGYMSKLQSRGVAEWWGMALTETTTAARPGWQYMKAILESWLAAGQPSTRKPLNGTDPTIRKSNVPATPVAEQAAAEARQAAYEQQIAEELERAGLLK